MKKMMKKKEIIQKINSHFGYKLIDEIKLKTINSKYLNPKNKEIKNKFNKNFQNKIDKIENKNIRESLSELLKEANK